MPTHKTANPAKLTLADTTQASLLRQASRKGNPPASGEFVHKTSSNHINYHAAPSTTFKTCFLRISFTLPLQAETAAQYSIIPSVLRRGTARHPSLAALAIRCEELYGASVVAMATRVGRQQLLSFGLQFPGPSMVRNGQKLFRDVIGLARELICEPLVIKGGFDPAIFASEQEQLVRSIRAIVDEKPSYAMFRALQVSFPNHPYGVPGFGSEQAVMALNPKTTLEAFERLRSEAILDVYLTGPIDLKRELGVAMKTFDGIKRTKPATLPLNTAAVAPNQLITAREKQPMEQSIAVMTFASGINVAHKDHAALQFADALFGKLSTSRLFRVVREEHGLAYSVGSSADDSTGLCTSYAGTDPKNQEKAIKLIKRELVKMQRELVSAEEFEAARNSLVNDLLAESDTKGSIIANLIIQRSCGTSFTPAKKMAMLKAVTPAKVRDVMRRLKPIAEFRLMPK